MARTHTVTRAPHARSGPMPLERQLAEDDDALRKLGYQRVLARRMTLFANFGVAFSVISVPTGLMVLYPYALNTGGPAELVWTWLLVGAASLLVGLGMAEICSAFPTCGALYFWTARLAKRHNNAWAWQTGILNLTGQVAVTASATYGTAVFLGGFTTLAWGWTPTTRETFAMFLGPLVICGLLNTFRVSIVAFLTKLSVWWNIGTVAMICAVLGLIPKHHASAPFVFTHVVNNTGFHSAIYVGAIGLLTSQWTILGFDGAGHMAEETAGAARNAPRGIVRSIAVAVIVGYALILAVTFAIQPSDYTNEASGGVSQVFMDALHSRATTEVLLAGILGAQFTCCMACVTANSRMIFAFCGRDSAFPLAARWSSVRKGTHTPAAAVWLAIALALILTVPALWSPTAFNAVASVSTIALYAAHAIPIFLRLRQGDQFEGGPWELGRWSKPVGILATSWVVVISVVFVLPQTTPITRDNFNYAGLVLAAVLGLSTVWWLAKARHRFRGVAPQGGVEELLALENGLA